MKDLQKIKISDNYIKCLQVGETFDNGGMLPTGSVVVEKCDDKIILTASIEGISLSSFVIPVDDIMGVIS